MRNLAIWTLCALLLPVALCAAAEERFNDDDHHVSLVPRPGWIAVGSPRMATIIGDFSNPFVRTVGADPARKGIALFRPEGATDIVPHIQVSVHDIGGLGTTGDDLERVRTTLENAYEEASTVPFRMFTLERVRINGYRAFRLTGVYRWRTVNVKILQYLLPGSSRLYCFTYTAKEREFSAYLPEAEEIAGTIEISDGRLDIEWLGGTLSNILLLLLVAGILLGILFANRISPQSLLESITFGRFSPTGKDGSGGKSNPFLKR